MKEYTSKNPVFSESIQLTETTDPAHADNINAATEQLLQNTLVLNKELQKIISDVKQSIEISFDTTLRAMFGLFENKAFSWTKCILYPNAMSWSGYPAARFTYVPASVCAANVGKQILLKFNNFLCLTTIKKTTSGSETYYYFNGTTWYSNESPATFGNANGNTTGGKAWTDNPTGSIGFTLNDGAVVFMTGTGLAVPDSYYYIL